MKKLSNLLSFLYASATVVYVSARDFGFIGTAIVLIVVLLMLYSTRIRAGCTPFVMLPFLLFFTIFVSMGTQRLDFGSSLYFFIVYAAILLSLSTEVWTATIGLITLGVAISAGGVSDTTDAIVFAFIVLLWLFTRNIRVPMIFMTVFPLLIVIVFLSASKLELGIANQFTLRSTEQQQTPSASSLEGSIPAGRSLGELDLFNTTETGESVPGKMLFMPDFLLNILLLLGAFSMILMMIKVKAFNGYLKVIFFSTAVFVMFIAISISVFMFLNQSEEKIVDAGAETGVIIPGKIARSVSTAEATSFTGLTRKFDNSLRIDIEWILLIAASGIVLLTGVFLLKLMKKTVTESTTEEVEAIPEEVELLPLDRFPELKFSKDYILSAYWWLRRKYFPNLHHLTPYELIRYDLESKYLQTLTEIYVEVRYAGKIPKKDAFHEFHDVLKEFSLEKENKISSET
ncbi:hypothetical protein [Kosmotoga pacifica]|uniref:DUF4129 domain-containing protein n=1 Tax=Kosmotoga pacifica TaxID=1330330 RepID=A0A0G2Z7C0_9BACT|nr:hypothetical protein [Kosmotoga pacifica]AKI97437.1 hypothetical protein IX53_05965 [Kosmotoga pacifica]